MCHFCAHILFENDNVCIFLLPMQASSSVPNLNEALHAPPQRSPQPAGHVMPSLALPSSSQALPADLSRAALNASFTESFLGGPLSDQAPVDTSCLPGSSPLNASQFRPLPNPGFSNIDSSASIGSSYAPMPSLDNSMRLRQLMASLQLQNAPTASMGYPSSPPTGQALDSHYASLAMPRESMLPLSGALHRAGSHSSLTSSQAALSPVAGPNSVYTAASPAPSLNHKQQPQQPTALNYEPVDLMFEANSLQGLLQPQFVDGTNDLTLFAGHDLSLAGQSGGHL